MPNFENNEYEVECECEECFRTLRDVPLLLLTKADINSLQSTGMLTIIQQRRQK